MEVHQTSIQYLKCMNCPRFLGKGCLICDLGHPSCGVCASAGQICSTCEKYVSGIRVPGLNSDRLNPNPELEEISKKVFSRCRNVICNRLIPLYVYEEHASSCKELGSVVACTQGCGVVEKCIASHLENVHGIRAESHFQNNCLIVYPVADDWLKSTWEETIIRYSDQTSVLICPKVENRVFSLGIFSLCSHCPRFKVKVKKGWNSSTFRIWVPNYDERTVPSTSKSNIFWNCEVNTLKNCFVDLDHCGRYCLKVLLTEIV